MRTRITLLVVSLVLVASACGTTAADPTVAAVQPAATTPATTRARTTVPPTTEDAEETFKADLRPAMLSTDLVANIQSAADAMGDGDLRGATRASDLVVDDLDVLLDAAQGSSGSDTVLGRSIIGALRTCRNAYSDVGTVLRGDTAGLDDALDGLQNCTAQISLVSDSMN